MPSFKLKLSLLALCAGLHASASASLLDPLEYVQSGKTWLQLSETAGLSIDDIEAGVGGWYANYRLASVGEVDQLLLDMNLFNVDYTTQTTPGMSDFFMKLGGITDGIYSGTWHVDGNAGARGRARGIFVDVGFTNGFSPVALSPDCPANNSCSYSSIFHGVLNDSWSSSSVGNFLVRRTADIPEPGSVALFGIAAALLVARRRGKGRAA